MQLLITNLIATATLNRRVEHEKVGRLAYATFDRSVYHCAYIRTSDMFSKVSLFSSGKMISVGTKSFKQASLDLKAASVYLARAGIIPVIGIRAKIQNIVVQGDLGTSLDLSLVYRLLDNSIYEPEQFPGIIHHPYEPAGSSILLFSSGKVVIAGLKAMNEIQLVSDYLKDLKERLLGTDSLGTTSLEPKSVEM